MASMKRGALVASTLTLITIIISACNQPYSQQPSVTNTPINPNSLFATPIGQTPSMNTVETFMTGTALAQQTATPFVSTLPVGTTVGVTAESSSVVAATPTPQISINPTSTLAVVGTQVVATQGGTLPTSVPVGSRPATYPLQPGEFPYCIARRFDVNPDELLSINGLASGDIYYADRSLKIPQSGSFPGTRALRNHPATYTVSASNETVYSIACLYGDVDPAVIAQNNAISSPGAALPVGKQLNIP